MRFIEMTFTDDEWRLIAVACTAVKKTSLIDPDGAKKLILHKITHKIATETGKHG